MKKTNNKKIITLFIILAVALGNAGSTLYLPAMVIIGQDFATTNSLMKLSLSFYLVTFGLSQLVYGPLSDAFGRRINLIIGLFIFFIGSLFTSFANNIQIFLLGRLIQGLGIGTTSAVSFALIRDIYQGENLTKQMSYLSVFVGMTPIIAPLFGGYLTQYLGWRTCFITLAILGLFLAVIKTLLLPETNIHLDQKACHPRTITKNFISLFKSRLFVGFVLVTSLGFTNLMVINGMLPFILITKLSISPSVYGWLTICTGGGYFSGAFFASRLATKFTRVQILLSGILIQLVLLTIGILIGMFYFNGWVVIVPLALILFGLGFVVPVGTSGAMEPFPKMAGSAAAILGACMFFISSLFMAMASWLQDQSQIPMFIFLFCVGILTLFSLLLTKEPAHD